MSRPYGRRPPYTRRVRVGFTVLTAMFVEGALWAALFLHLSPHANGTPMDADQQAFEYWAHHGSSVCRTLDFQPTVDGIVVAALDIFQHGLTTKQAGQILNLAIHFTCPQHQNLIDQYNASHRVRGQLA